MSIIIAVEREDKEAPCCVCGSHYVVDALELCEICDQLYCENCGVDDECDDCADSDEEEE